MRSWTWTARYAVVLLAAALLGAGIGELEVFKETALGTRKLHAAELATFLGYGGALVIVALIARRAVTQLRGSGSGAAHLASILPALAALLILSAGYHVVLTVLDPFLSSAQRNVYNWGFVLGISGSAVWLIVALYRHSEGLAALFEPIRPQGKTGPTACASCGAALHEHAKFCSSCGKTAAA